MGNLTGATTEEVISQTITWLLADNLNMNLNNEKV